MLTGMGSEVCIGLYNSADVSVRCMHSARPVFALIPVHHWARNIVNAPNIMIIRAIFFILKIVDSTYAENITFSLLNIRVRPQTAMPV